MATQASVRIQDILYTEKTLGLLVTVSYTNGATAGAEVVSVSNHAITVQIQSGVSTATQIKAAVDACYEANKLVTVTIPGTAGTAQVTVKGAYLTGGAAAAKAVLNVGCLKFTAKSTGTGGNSTRIKITTGATAGSEVVSVSTADITIQIAEGVSTGAQVKTAVEASEDAAALVDVASSGAALSNVMRLAMAPAFAALSGGVTAIAATKTLQNLVYTAAATGVGGNAVTISYTTGATAGSEVVTAVGSAVSIQIENGVSTATQIKTAYDLVAAATALATVATTGTASTAQKTVNALPTASGVGDGAQSYYVDGTITALTASFVRFNFSCHAGYLKMICDETSGPKGIVYSFDGANTHGTLLFGQVIEIQDAHRTGIWLKYVSAAPAYRLMVVGR